MAFVPPAIWAATAAAGVGAVANAALAPKPPKVPAPPSAPTQNSASNAAQQQEDILRKRRGVLSNIYGGAQPGAGAAPVAKATLG